MKDDTEYCSYKFNSKLPFPSRILEILYRCPKQSQGLLELKGRCAVFQTLRMYIGRSRSTPTRSVPIKRLTVIKNGVTNGYEVSTAKKRIYISSKSVPIECWKWVQAKTVGAASYENQDFAVWFEPGHPVKTFERITEDVTWTDSSKLVYTPDWAYMVQTK
jgi:hypothetical protein